MAEPNGKEPEKTSWIVQARAQFEAQPELFPDPDIPNIDKTTPKRQCTGGRLFKEDPEAYQGIVKALATPGCSVRWICDTYHVPIIPCAQ
jgi:hypothetical protein